jgi:DNA modification methylase
MQNPKIVFRDIADLTPYSRNPRVHSKAQIRQIARSIQQFGWTLPILIDTDGGIIAGHARLEAAKLLGLDQVPTLCLEGLSEAQKRAYIIADNRLAESASWDLDLLGHELQVLSEVELDFDLSVTGFEPAEVDLLIDGAAPEIDDEDADRLPEGPDEMTAVSRHGDLWELGDHRLLCGDTRSLADCQALLGGDEAQMVFTDPPYNVAIDGHVCGSGAIRHREFAMASGEMSSDQFQAFLTTALSNLAAVSQDGALHFVCIDWRHVSELLGAARDVYSETKNLCVWAKENAGMGSLYRSQHELIYVFKRGRAPHVNNIELGRYGRNRTNVWRYPGISSLGKNRQAQLAMHPTVKPVALVADAIRDCSHRGGLILDGFAGSGTTIIAAEKTGRRARCLEIDPIYVDTAIRRWETYSGAKAIEVATGQTFAEVAQAREVAPDATQPSGDDAGLQDQEAHHDR